MAVMPTYIFVYKNDENENNQWEEIMSIADMQTYLKDYPEIRQVIGAPSTGDPHKLSAGGHKPDDAFRDLLREMGKNKPRNNINTF